MRTILVTEEELRQIIREEVAALARPEPARPPAPMTTEEAAIQAGRSAETIRDWIQSGRLRALPRSGRQHYRIRPEDLEAALEAPEGDGLDAEARAGAIIRRIHG